MKQRVSKRVLSLVLCLLLLGSNSITAMATSASGEGMSDVPEATSVLVDVEEAQQSLKALAAEREIPALLYLKDIYTIKTEPDRNSNDVAAIASGQQVYITGVGEDKGHNIWYQVTYSYDGGDLSGYIEREYLAFSDERMIEWESMNIRSMMMFRLRRSGVSYADVEQFPDSYQDALYRLKQQHPNWKFVKMETGLDWDYVVNVQSEADRSLVSNNSSPDSWKDGYYSSSWAIASDGIIKYYLDPRNALSEKLIFQFEQLTYNESYHSLESTQKVIQGTFMDDVVPGEGISYAQAFMNIAAEKNISPVLMAARVRQEQGVKGSLMISGTYPGYEGLYNHYNIGASGNTQEKELQTGLSKAREMGWTTPMLSLSGGSNFLSNSYIRRGQDTLYLQKFDVDSSYDGVCWHQYMQNIAAPESEALSTYRAYSNAGIVDSAFVFKIPVYRNMPSYACTKPGSEEKVTLNVTSIENLPVDGTATLISYINGSQNTSVAMEFASSDTDVATVDSNGVVTGINPGRATITCKRAENAESATTASCAVTVIKADIDISEIEVPDIEITYLEGQTLSEVELPEGFSWVDGNVIPTVGNSGYNVIYDPDSSKYNPVTMTVPVTVNKAVTDSASLTLPTGLTAVAGYELGSVALPSGYAWDNPTEKLPKKVGTYRYGASYCEDELNYEVLEDITLSVEVVCKTHEFGDWQGTHADCINDGELIRSCEICGATEMVTEDATGHEYENEVTQEPTLLVPGIRTYTCIRCQDTYDVEIPVVVGPHTHEYEEEITIEPGCESAGIRKYTCDCEDTYTETIEPLGHDVVDGACTRCDYEIQTLPSHTHSYTFSGSTETCTEAGEAIYICGCGDSYTEERSALGHDIVDGACTRCDYEVEKPAPHEHSYTLSGSTQTCTKAGEATYVCGCGDSYTEERSALGHDMVDGKCSRCEYVEELPDEGKDDGKEEPGGNESGGNNTDKDEPGSDNAGNGSDKENTGDDNTDKDEPGSDNTDNGSDKENAGGSNTDKDEPGSDNTGDSDKDNSGESDKENSDKENSGESDKDSSSDKGNSSSNNTNSDNSGNGGLLSAIQNIVTSIIPPKEEPATVEEIPINPPTDNQVAQNTQPQSAAVQKTEEPEKETDVTEQDVVEETADAVKITMKHSTMLNKDKLAIVSDANRKLELVMADNVKWNIDLSGVEDVHNIDVDMAVTMNRAEIPKEVISTLPKDNPIILMSLSHEGPFEFEARLSVPVNRLNAGRIANLFYYNPATGQMEFVASSLVADDGSAEFLMEHASDYAIVVADNSLNPNEAKEAAETVAEDVTEKESEAGMATGMLIAMIVAVAVLAVAGIVFVIQFFVKKARDSYYLDEEDEETTE